VREHAEAPAEPVVEPSPPQPVASGSTAPARAATAARLLRALPATPPGIEARGVRALARAVQVRSERRLARIFEKPEASKDAAGAKAAINEFEKLKPAAREAELTARYGSGDLAKSLNQLGRTAGGARAPMIDKDIRGTVMSILRWVEETAARKHTGKTDKELAALQAAFLKGKAAAKKPAPAGWGGVSTAKTRWASLSKAEQKSWTKRGKDAIKRMAAFCASDDPELGVTESSFELDFAGVDEASLGAIATVGSKPGRTIQVGFEFVVAVEMDPKYALSTVVHELYGHPGYDRGADTNYSKALYLKSIAGLSSKTVADRTGDQTYAYWPSEIYSLVKEFHYFTAVTAADAAKQVALPGSTTSMTTINYAPTGGGGVKRHLKTMQQNWDPTVLEGLLRGLYERFRHDPTIWANSLTAYVAAVEDVFGAAYAKRVSK
jgi:hypothetical protein